MLWELGAGGWLLGWLGAVFLPQCISGWGWLMPPFEIVMLYGAVWRGWNRCIVAGLLALAAGIVALFEYGPWYGLRLILPLALVLFGTAVERGWFIRRRPRPAPSPVPEEEAPVPPPEEDVVESEGQSRPETLTE